MFQRILVCTDFTDGLQRLVHFVPSLAASGIKQITFLHTIPLSGDREIPRLDADEAQLVRDRLSPALQEIPDGVEVNIDVQWGRPLDHILNAAKTHQIELILLGMPSRSLLTEKLFGSTTMELCQRITTPLMILRPQLISTYTVEELDLRCRHLFRYFLVPYDSSDAAKYLVDKIKQFAQTRSSDSLKQCLLYWVLDDVRRRELPPDHHIELAKEKLTVVKEDLETLGLVVEMLAVEGNAITEVLMAAQEYDISAIAISSDSLGKLLEWSVPSFAGELIRQSWHPVLYFPPAR